ncbi:MAG: L-lactate permease [Treponema sp.]|jgi:lactate permease|nr:L-lactate permease [Treponema sp.]
MQWIQNYYVVGNNIFLTAFVAMLPVIFLFWALAIKKMKGYLAILIAWFITLLVAIIAYRMPIGTALSAAGYGALQGVFLLCWLVFNAMFFYNIIVKSGNFDIIKSSIASISDDRRIQAILIGFCFSAFLEGTTAQGAPVAIAAAMLIGLGFPVFPSAVICLVGNTVPVPYSPVGMPTITTVNTAFSGVPDALLAVSGTVGGVMCIYALIIPIFMLVIMAGWKAAKEVVPLCITASVAYLIPNFFISRYIGPELPSLISPLVSLAAAVTFLKFWKPKTIWRFEGDAPVTGDQGVYGTGKILNAWTPFILVTLFMALWSLPVFKEFSARLPIRIAIGPWPGLHGVVYRATPIVKEPATFAANFNFDLLAAAGTAVLFVALLTALIYKIKPSVFIEVMAATFRQLKFALLTIILVLSIAHLSNYSGISFTLGLAFAATGSLFMFFSPLIGFLGVFLTGSVTSSGALFGNLQRVTAEQLGLNPLITITSNIVGAVMGKLVSPQSIAIGAAATGLVGQEGIILNKTVKYALILLGIGIVIMLILAYLFPGYFPQMVS